MDRAAQVRQGASISHSTHKPLPAGNVIAFTDPVKRHRARVPSLQVLVADENADAGARVAELLARSGHEVCRVDAGEDALDALAAGGFGAAIVSMGLPEFSGLDIVRHLRVMQPGDRQRTPILVLSADDAGEEAQACLRAGAHAVLTRPVEPETLLDHIAMMATSTAPSADPPGRKPMSNAGSHSTITGTPVLDASFLAEYVAMGLGAEFISELQKESLRDCTYCLSCLEKAGMDGDWLAFREHAYAIKGVAASLGLVRLSNAASALLQLPSDELATSWRIRHTSLLDRLDQARQALADLAADQQSTQADVTWLKPRQSTP